MYNAYRFSPPALNRLIGHRGSARAAFSHDARRAITGDDNGTVRIWDLVTGQQLLCLGGNTGPITCVAFAPDGLLVARGAADGVVRVWDLRDGRTSRCWNLRAVIRQIAFSPDGTHLGAGYAAVTIWDLRDGTPTVITHNAAAAFAFSPDSSTCLTGETFWNLGLWDLKRRSTVRTFHFSGLYPDAPTCVAFSSDGSRFLACSEEKLWVGDLRQERPSVLASEPGGFETAGFDDSGDHILAAGRDGVIRALDSRSASVLYRVWADEAPLSKVTFSSDCRWALSSARDGSVEWLSASEPEEPRRLQCPTKVQVIASQPRGGMMVAGTPQRDVAIRRGVGPAPGPHDRRRTLGFRRGGKLGRQTGRLRHQPRRRVWLGAASGGAYRPAREARLGCSRRRRFARRRTRSNR